MAKPDSYGRFFYRRQGRIIAVAIVCRGFFAADGGISEDFRNFLKRQTRSFSSQGSHETKKPIQNEQVTMGGGRSGALSNKHGQQAQEKNAQPEKAPSPLIQAFVTGIQPPRPDLTKSSCLIERKTGEEQKHDTNGTQSYPEPYQGRIPVVLCRHKTRENECAQNRDRDPVQSEQQRQVQGKVRSTLFVFGVGHEFPGLADASTFCS